MFTIAHTTILVVLQRNVLSSTYTAITRQRVMSSCLLAWGHSYNCSVGVTEKRQSEIYEHLDSMVFDSRRWHRLLLRRHTRLNRGIRVRMDQSSNNLFVLLDKFTWTSSCKLVCDWILRLSPRRNTLLYAQSLSQFADPEVSTPIRQAPVYFRVPVYPKSSLHVRQNWRSWNPRFSNSVRFPFCVRAGIRSFKGYMGTLPDRGPIGQLQRLRPSQIGSVKPPDTYKTSKQIAVRDFA